MNTNIIYMEESRSQYDGDRLSEEGRVCAPRLFWRRNGIVTSIVSTSWSSFLQSGAFVRISFREANLLLVCSD